MALALAECMQQEEDETETETETDSGTGTPLRYVDLQHLYSSTSPCSTSAATTTTTTRSSNVTTKKVKARKLIESMDHEIDDANDSPKNHLKKPPLRVYQRRAKTPRHSPSLLDAGEKKAVEAIDFDPTPDRAFDSGNAGRNGKSRTRVSTHELRNLGGADSGDLVGSSGHRLRWGLRSSKIGSIRKCDLGEKRRKPDSQNDGKRWAELILEDADPHVLIGFKCKVHWPLDAKWYDGLIDGYNEETCRHHIKYADGEEENLILLKESVKFKISCEEMQRLKLTTVKKEGLDYDEMLALAVAFGDCQELELGDIVWAKLTGHAMWPALIINESQVRAKRVIKRGDKSVPVQFFGTHDFAWINIKQAVSFVKGLQSSFHLKCKQARFIQSLEEAKMYLNVQKLPAKMLQMQTGIVSDEAESGGEDRGRSDFSEDEGMRKRIKTCPFDVGTLRVICLGKIVRDSEYFRNRQYIWPEGYTAVRKYTSTTDPSVSTSYKMEVLRDPESNGRPLFRVTLDNGEQINGSRPSVCWKEIYKKIDKLQNNTNGFRFEVDGNITLRKPGSYMFGFSIKKVFELIQEAFRRSSECHASGYRPIHLDLKDIDKCSVCHMDEEYVNNLFLQCDKCRMTVHARCYGEMEPLDGKLWLCNLCRPGAPISPPACCLCPVIGGAMKPTTNGQWAHLTCAMWIPETYLQDIKRMEPIDGIDRIHKDRWKLLCSICGVSYGACVQCSHRTCYVAYHPLCARAAGLCVELDEDELDIISFNEDDDLDVRLLSFCKKHRRPSSERAPADEQIVQTLRNCSHYTPPRNPSGCARCEPYDFVGRRGRKEPAALTAVSGKQLFVENRPYLVSGYRQNGSLSNPPSCNELVLKSFSSRLQKMKAPQSDTPMSFDSKAEKYQYMRKTFKKRLAFGKSAIHGFGIFAKLPHRAGDMVIEYTGEIVRPSVADTREHRIYDSLVGAGTYMFRLDDERVIDATKAGSIAHLINHSCEPNCFSRTINVHGDEHIIIFAKRDINQWEELTYDYRFTSKAKQLACCCGSARCRGVVNELEAEEPLDKIHVPQCDRVERGLKG
ncbi:hypothetical protein MRB53_010035 [Persea americana]|uniref:Uncharacterized protein n=1 Tax=Persea americana TaxID=3435 RepID=A0ACC2LQT2_PERAE|nr:hypothetical protein MRB53_010035 [Persea americana]